MQALGHYLTHVHLHDNDGSGDQHLPLGQGTVPLPDVFAALDAYAPDAIWTIETDAVQSLEWMKRQGIINTPAAQATSE